MAHWQGIVLRSVVTNHQRPSLTFVRKRHSITGTFATSYRYVLNAICRVRKHSLLVSEAWLSSLHSRTVYTATNRQSLASVTLSKTEPTPNRPCDDTPSARKPCTEPKGRLRQRDKREQGKGFPKGKALSRKGKRERASPVKRGRGGGEKG